MMKDDSGDGKGWWGRGGRAKEQNVNYYEIRNKKCKTFLNTNRMIYRAMYLVFVLIIVLANVNIASAGMISPDGPVNIVSRPISEDGILYAGTEYIIPVWISNEKYGPFGINFFSLNIYNPKLHIIVSGNAEILNILSPQFDGTPVISNRPSSKINEAVLQTYGSLDVENCITVFVKIRTLGDGPITIEINGAGYDFNNDMYAAYNGPIVETYNIVSLESINNKDLIIKLIDKRIDLTQKIRSKYTSMVNNAFISQDIQKEYEWIESSFSVISSFESLGTAYGDAGFKGLEAILIPESIGATGLSFDPLAMIWKIFIGYLNILDNWWDYKFPYNLDLNGYFFDKTSSNLLAERSAWLESNQDDIKTALNNENNVLLTIKEASNHYSSDATQKNDPEFEALFYEINNYVLSEQKIITKLTELSNDDDADGTMNAFDQTDSRPPVPYVTTDNEPFSLLQNQEKNIVFTIQNIGGPTNEGYLDISVSNGLDIIGASSTSPTMTYDNIGPNSANPDDLVWTIYDTQISPQYELISAHEGYTAGELKRFTIRIKVIGLGQQWIKYRVSMQSLDDYVRFPGSGEVDQQGWYAVTFPISTIINPPAAPLLNDPGTINTEGIYSITWSQINGASYYVLEEDSSNIFSTPVQLYSGKSTFKSVIKTNDGTYYYRVKACNSDGCSVSNIENITVKINNPPNIPNNPFPQDGSVNQSVNLNLKWDGGDNDGNNIYYDIYLDTNPNPKTMIYSGTENNTIFVSLDHNTKYYWKVIASDLRSSSISPVWNFTTKQLTVCPTDCGYNSIQAAINAAREGNIIPIYSGTYFENVYVNKKITLWGLDMGGGKPVVDAGGSTIYGAISLIVDAITVKGLKVINSDSYGGGIGMHSNNNIVEDNEFVDNYYGISISNGGSNNTLKGNTIVSIGNGWGAGSGAGINCNGANNNSIIGNTIENYYEGNGIFIGFNSMYNQINGNIVSGNRQGIRLAYYADFNTIIDNDAHNNEYGISIEDSSYNTFKKNNVKSNDMGIFIDDYISTSYNNILYQNNISENRDYFFNKIYNVFDEGENNWDNGTIGNIYSDFDEPEDGCNDVNIDGICDSNYSIPGGSNVDRYPLVLLQNQDLIYPPSISNITNITYELDYINFTWTNPPDPDFSHVMLYLNGTFITSVQAPQNYYNFTGLEPDTLYELGTHTVDMSGNVNETWVNATARTLPLNIEKIDFTLPLKTGWNMVSLPIIPADPSVTAIFGSNVSTVYGWTGTSYVLRNELEPKKGYWALSNGNYNITVNGTPVVDRNITLTGGWNMVGPITNGIMVSSLPNVTTVYGWTGTSYTIVSGSNTLTLTRGYWILANATSIIQV